MLVCILNRNVFAENCVIGNGFTTVILYRNVATLLSDQSFRLGVLLACASALKSA
jgi:hypothetical protein